MTAPTRDTDARREIRRAAERYEQARTERTRAGEALRLRLRKEGTLAAADTLLLAIRTGELPGPFPDLGREYHESWAREQRAGSAIGDWLGAHPAWGWLGHVGGVTPARAARLLSWLDPAKASTPSAFWAYCGLGTVSTGDGRRAAQTGRARGEMKALCHAIGMALVRANGAYARYYRSERASLERTRPTWAADRKHLTALRKTEKLFLAHLWLVWRESLGMPVTEPHENDRRAATGPWDMVGPPARRRWLRSDDGPPPRLAG